MTSISEMIKELCPNGVSYVSLGGVLDYEQPTKYLVKSKEYSDDYSTPVLTAGQTFILGYTNEVSGVYQASPDNPVIIFDDFTTAKKWVDFEFKVKSSAMKMITVKPKYYNDVSLRYIWHCLGTIRYEPEQHSRQWIGIYSNIQIPLPPLEIQQEIVKTLDKFTDYVTELTTELTLRQKQYSHYRDKLLSFEDEVYQVEWKTLGEVANFRRGSFPQPYTDMSFYGGEDAQPFVQVVDVADEGFRLNTKTKKTISQKAIPKSVFVPKGTVIVTLQGTLGRVAVTQYNAYVDRTLAIFDGYKQEVDKRYFAHQLKFIFDREKEFARGSTLKTITKEEFSKFKIPLPSLNVQSRIVQVLDNFDTVCNDLNIGLPKEIELRQKQYEFFRDKLLTFTAAGVYTDSTVQYRQDLIRLLTWVFGPIRVKLGAITDISRGKRVVRKELSDDTGYPVYQNSLTTLGYYEKFNTPSNTTFIVSAGAAGEIGFSDEKFWKADDVWTLETDSIDQRFLYHVLLNQQGQIKGQVRKASIPRLSKISIENLIVNLPSLSEQRSITSVLDKFDTITTDLTQGLPKEIQQRQQQYEYFRDKLLQF